MNKMDCISITVHWTDIKKIIEERREKREGMNEKRLSVGPDTSLS